MTDSIDAHVRLDTHPTHPSAVTAVLAGAQARVDTERSAVEARATLDLGAAKPGSPGQEPETVPVYLADTGDHDALLDAFLDAHGEFEKWRTWSDDTTHAIHESQTLRIERVHEAHPRDNAWTVAAYETPVSDRLWHLTMTGTTPAPVLQTLLDRLAEGEVWDFAIGDLATGRAIAQATCALTDAGWQNTVDGRWIRWETTQGDAGVQFDAFAARQTAGTLSTWTLWAGPGIDRPAWAVNASAHTPVSLIADLTEELAHGIGTRCQRPRLASAPPAVAPVLPETRPSPRR
ncbi:DUF317 domain-containing protein [Streptomyces sp. NRRL S-37]|uniref:DUF317 domain-containing protein n=1 Tax=Streptomyces sp. NRRL S-37 TaxID=1463903 RepID=UPI00068FFCC0|nr:DUF317 domain-containing protein [Streptomyces sp. NRRL S-37]